MKKQYIYAACAVAVLVLAYAGYKAFYPKNYLSVMAVTGATPLALTEDMKGGLNLEISGATKRVYKFDGDSLAAFAPTYVRTREVAPDGSFQGTYRYHGISVLHILEGIAPKKPEGAAFDKPLDMIVAFVNGQGKEIIFSYCELTMVTDADAPVLAFSRKELLPNDAKTAAIYDKNIHKGKLNGLRLICPAEPDTVRYLDDVRKIEIRESAVPNKNLPVTKKGEKCVSTGITCVRGAKTAPVTYQGVSEAAVSGWVRTGHGKGFKGVSKANGYNLLSLLQANFPGCGSEQYYLFVACDGYRVLFSGRELFLTDAGKKAMLLKTVDGTALPDGPMLGPVADYFVDRDVWGLSHIVVLEKP
ncbi:MAG: hypothetical protein EPN93_15325 [Spirochaetes bacterium]|nr:MAG: hypothetical protein EPN93_15325 [Spirochaetota bacterium]